MKNNLPVVFIILLAAFAVANCLLLLPNIFALDCKLCTVGACYCNVTECSAGSMDIFMSQCTGIPMKEIVFTNGSFVWIDAQAKSYYFQAFCDSGNKTNCTNVNLTSTNVTTTTTTTSTTSSTSSTSSTTTTPQKSACLLDCCVDNPQYFNKYCDEGYDCTNNRCILTSSSSSTTSTENPPEINYSLIGGVIVLIIIAVFAYYFLKGRQKPTEKWDYLYKKYGRR